MVKWDENGLTVTEEVSITRDEAEALVDWIERDFIEFIRRNDDCDNIYFVEDILRIFRKCKDCLEKGAEDGEREEFETVHE